MTKKLLYFVLILPFIMSCSGKQAPKETLAVDTIPMMVMQIQKCSRLYTAEVRVHKIVTHDDTKKLEGKILQKSFSIDLPLGERKVAIPMDATVKAYVDFDGFSANNVHRNGRKIEITLPDPKVTLTGTRINHDDVKCSHAAQQFYRCRTYLLRTAGARGNHKRHTADGYYRDCS